MISAAPGVAMSPSRRRAKERCSTIRPAGMASEARATEKSFGQSAMLVPLPRTLLERNSSTLAKRSTSRTGEGASLGSHILLTRVLPQRPTGSRPGSLFSLQGIDHRHDFLPAAHVDQNLSGDDYTTPGSVRIDM
jgi:hypothetical protein